MIIMDLQFSLCLEPDICYPVIDVLKSQLLQLPMCEMQMEFNTRSKYVLDLVLDTRIFLLVGIGVN